jgi:hypothetical protein
LRELFLFKCKDGKVSLDETVTVDEKKEPESANGQQVEQPALAAQVEADDGLGHELEAVEAGIAFTASMQMARW